jgi:hypothetical protein
MDRPTDHYEPLPLQTLSQLAPTLPRAEPHVWLTDPATEVFTDLRVAPGVTVPATDSLEDTRRLMQLAGVRMAFVIDAAERIIGMVTLSDMQGEHAAQVARTRGVPQRDLPVLDVTTPVSRWSTIDHGRLAWAKVGHLVATFRATGQRYLIVTEQVKGQDGQPHTVIRGVFSANRVERATGHTIEDALRSRNFAELAGVLTER